MKSLQGSLIVASPHLPDPNFFRTVVLMVQHGEEGALGVVLNRPSQKSVREIWEQVGDTSNVSDRVVNLGGPILGPLMAVHGGEPYSEAQIMPGVYFATHKDRLERIVTQDEFPYLLFSGYAGWSAGQLESEIEAGGWLVMPPTVDFVFPREQPADLWKRVAERIGEDILFSSIKIKHVPPDPSSN